MEPQQYTTKTMPKKISNLKKAKESTATFYTDLSDSECCDIINESNDSLECPKDDSLQEETCENVKDKNEQVTINMNTLEKVVSDLLMQNKEFQKILNKRKNGRGSEPLANVWSKKSEEKEEENMPAKADSLPRNIQLNDQIGSLDKTESQEKDVRDEKSAKTEVEEERDV